MVVPRMTQVAIQRGHGIVSETLSKTANDTQAIREVLAQHGRLSGDVQTLDEDGDLYSAGLTSLATVGIMLALEDRFDIEFPESKLTRVTFRSISSIAEAIAELAN
jgi:acyl carrier protein